eukprot:m.142402 g.142402  ORF g.142402 m.142402 type:complete len:587 (-) comp14056_c1_seq1:215-1975(-)
MAARPTTGMRIGTGYRRQGTARMQTGRLGTGRLQTGRLTTAMMQAGAGGVIGQVNLSARPMTKQGLGGTRPKTQGPGRMIMDETFFLGQLRAKSTEISEEIKKLQQEFGKLERDQQHYTVFEKKAETMATEIQGLQGQLASLNMLANNLHEHVPIEEVLKERDELKVKNDREAADADGIFSDRTRVDRQIKDLERELEIVQNTSATIIETMTPDERAQYDDIVAETEQMQQDIAEMQAELADLTEEDERLHRELQMNPLKQEAAGLYDQIASLEAKQEKLKEDVARDEALSPEALKQKLHAEVKQDSQEIAAMERKIVEVEQRIKDASSELADLENGEEEEVDETKRQKYMQLVKHEQEMDAFLLSFDETFEEEVHKVQELEGNVEELLEAISASLLSIENLPSQDQAVSLKDDLDFKSGELQKSAATTKALEAKRAALAADLKNVEGLEDKISSETAAITQDLERMREEMTKFEDVDGLAARTEEVKEQLSRDKKRLSARREAMKRIMQDLAARCDKMKKQLSSDETFTQLGNLEKKWAHYEKNNFVVAEFIAAKAKESDCSRISASVQTLVKEHNDHLHAINRR